MTNQINIVAVSHETDKISLEELISGAAALEGVIKFEILAG